MQQKYQFTPAMREISGFGGAYEECCRRMLAAALDWLDAHPEAEPKYRGYEGFYGLISEENADAKALSKATCEAAGDTRPIPQNHPSDRPGHCSRRISNVRAYEPHKTSGIAQQSFRLTIGSLAPPPHTTPHHRGVG